MFAAFASTVNSKSYFLAYNDQLCLAPDILLANVCIIKLYIHCNVVLNNVFLSGNALMPSRYSTSGLFKRLLRSRAQWKKLLWRLKKRGFESSQ